MILFLILLFPLVFLMPGCEKEILGPDPIPDKLFVTVEPIVDTVADIGDIVPYEINTNAKYMVRLIEGKSSEDTTFFSESPVTFTLQFPILKVGRNELFLRFFKEGSERIPIDRVVVGKDTTVIPPPPTPPVIEMPDILHASYNTSINVTVLITGATSVTSDLPGFSGLTGGTFATPILTYHAVYHISASNEVGTTVDSVMIAVVDFPSSPFMDVITEHLWSVISGMGSCECDENGPWYEGTFSQIELDTKYSFKKDGSWEAYRYGILVNWGDFSIIDSTLYWGGVIYKIQVLNSETMELLHSGALVIGCPGGIGCIMKTYGSSAPE